MPLENRFQFAQNSLNNEMTLLDASMSDFSYGTHAHEEFSFGVTLSGRQDFFARGKHHKSHPSNVIIFNPDEAHDGHSGGDCPLHYKMLYIHPDKLIPMLKSVGISNMDDFYFTQCVQSDAVLLQHILHLASLVECTHASTTLYSSALFEFAQYLALLKGVHVEQKVRGKSAVFERVREYIHCHVTNEVCLDDLSKVAHMSKYHFLRSFRDYFGMTPHKYWQSYRLSRAKKAIELGMSIADVQYTFGFSDLSYFNRCFKPVFGVTPYQFQRNFRLT